MKYIDLSESELKNLVGENNHMCNNKLSDKESNYLIDVDDIIEIGGTSFCRIIAKDNIGCVKKGDLGGYIESVNALNPYDKSWLNSGFALKNNGEVYDLAKCDYIRRERQKQPLEKIMEQFNRQNNL